MGALQILGANWLEFKTVGIDLRVIDNLLKLVDETHNLWFLYYLTMHFLSLAAVVVIWKKLIRPSKTSLFIKTANWQLVLAMAAMSLLLATIGYGADPGRINASLAFKPDLLVYLYFGVFFAFGWA